MTRRRMMVSMLVMVGCVVLLGGLSDTFQAQGPPDPAQLGPHGTARITVTIENPLTGDELVTDLYYPADGDQVDPGGAPYPALVFAHGLSAFRGVHAGNAAHLASWGYLVMVPDLPNNLEDRYLDILFLFDWLEAQNGDVNSPFHQQADMERISIAGHSLGGASTWMVAARDQRFSLAAVPLDAVVPPVDYEGTGTWDFAAEVPYTTAPIGLIGAPAHYCNYNAQYEEVYPLVGSTHKARIIIQGANHCDFIDGEDPAMALACLDWCGEEEFSEERLRLIEKYTAAWFNYYLRLDTDAYPYLYGEQAEEDIQAGRISLESETAPRNVAARGGSREVELSWTLYEHPIIAGYNIYRSQEAGSYPEAPYAQVGRESSFVDTGVVEGQTYYYVVRSRDPAGNEHQPSVEVSIEVTDGLPPDPGGLGPFHTERVTVDGTNPDTGDELTWDIYYPAGSGGVDPGGAPYPALAFAHGTSAPRASNAGNAAHLASWGYLVMLPDLPNNLEDRYSDLLFLFDWLEAQNADPGSPFYQQADMERISITGHSLGGASTWMVAARDERFSLAAVPLDAVVPPGLLGTDTWDFRGEAPQITAPIGLIGAPSQLCNAYAQYEQVYPLVGSAHKAKILIEGASHCDFLGARPRLLAEACTLLCGGDYSEERLRLIEKYTAAWFNYYVRFDTSFYPYLYGEEAEEDIQAGRVSVESETAPRNVAATGGSREVELSWSLYEHPIIAGYNIYRSQERGSYPEAPYAQVGRESSFVDTGVVQGQEYSYVVCSRDPAGNEHQRSAEVSVVAADGALSTPALLAPPDGLQTTDRIITFAWEPGPGVAPEAYNFDLQGEEISLIMTTTRTSWPALLSPGPHSWTVRAYEGGTYSDWVTPRWTLQVAESLPPGVPTLLSPADGTVTSGPSTTFTWAPGPGTPPEGYHLQIDGEVLTTTDTSWSTALSAGIHTWTVRAYDGGEYSDWATPAWTLEVIDEPVPPDPDYRGPYNTERLTFDGTNPETGDELAWDIYYPADGDQVDAGGAPYPALAFAHGLAASRAVNAGNAAHLASWGFLVVVPDLPNDLKDRYSDLLFLFDWLEAQNGDVSSPFYQQADLERISIAGHSLGGASTWMVAARDERLTLAAVPLDAVVPPNLISGDAFDQETEAPKITAPIGLIGAPSCLCNYFAQYEEVYPLVGSAHKAKIVIEGANHCDFLDPEDPALAEACTVVCGGDYSEERLRLIEKYTAAWFNYYVGLDTDAYPYLYGEEAEEDIQAGRISLESETAPHDVAATGGSREVELSWSLYEHPIIAGYNIYRSQDRGSLPEAPYAQVGRESSFVDTGVVEGQTYFYVVCSRDAAGNEHQPSELIGVLAKDGEPGAPVQRTPPNGLETRDQVITFTWDPGPGGTPVGYFLTVEGASTSYDITTMEPRWSAVLPDGLHSWTVQAFNDDGASAWAAPWTVQVDRYRTFLPLAVR